MLEVERRRLPLRQRLGVLCHQVVQLPKEFEVGMVVVRPNTGSLSCRNEQPGGKPPLGGLEKGEDGVSTDPAREDHSLLVLML